MKIHEYQGKQILGRYGVAVRAHPCFSVDEALAAAEQLGGPCGWSRRRSTPAAAARAAA